jgi:hypothetical protein
MGKMNLCDYSYDTAGAHWGTLVLWPQTDQVRSVSASSCVSAAYHATALGLGVTKVPAAWEGAGHLMRKYMYIKG